MVHKTLKKIRNNGRAYLDRKLIAAVAVVALAVIPFVLAQSENGVEHGRPQIARAEAGHSLTPASTAAPETVVRGYLKSRGGASEDAVASLQITGTNAGRNGVTHLRMEQQIDGLTVYGAYVKASVNSDGELISVIDRIYGAGDVRPSRVPAAQALAAAIANLYPAELRGIRSTGVRGNTSSFNAGSFFYGEPTVTAVVVPLDDGSLEHGWLVQTWTAKTNELNYSVVDGGGRVLEVESRTASDSYNVFSEDPLKGPQTAVSGAVGWLGTGSQSTVNISGNNAHAYLDSDANNAPDSGGTAVADGNFLTAANLGQAPTTAGNKAVAVQNLFYFNNVMHDVLNAKGFDAAAGNFEGNDPVNAEAQDGSGTDNANFSTPADGTSPRMQMYLWTGSAPDSFVTAGGHDYGAYASAFGTAVTATGITANLQVISPSDGCAAAPAGSLTGKTAIIERGVCNFTDKVLNAQKGSAVAAVITNNVEGNAFGPGGTDRKVKIPSAMVTLTDGAALRGLAGTSSRLHKSGLTALQIDGDIDADVVFHEYGHGLTWRMIGGMSGKVAGALGEGASDVNAFLVNGDDRIGEYAFSNPVGIRRYAYEGYPLTYKDFTGTEVHNDGEIYAAAMWSVRQNYLGAGLTVDALQADWVDGMNSTPSTPKYEDMRDGMLTSIGTDTVRSCAVWRGFAKFGIGVGSSLTISRRGTSTITESYNVPSGCAAP